MVSPAMERKLSRSLVRVPGSGHWAPAGATILDFSRVSSLAALVPVSPHLPPGILQGAPVPTLLSSITGDRPLKLKPNNSTVTARGSSTVTAANDENKMEDISSRNASNVATTTTESPLRHQEATVGVMSEPESKTFTSLSSETTEIPIQFRKVTVELVSEPASMPASAPGGASMRILGSGLLATPLRNFAAPATSSSARTPVITDTSSSRTRKRSRPQEPPSIPANDGVRPTKIPRVSRSSPAPDGFMAGLGSLEEERLVEMDRLRSENLAAKRLLHTFYQLFRDKEKLVSLVRHLGYLEN